MDRDFAEKWEEENASWAGWEEGGMTQRLLAPWPPPPPQPPPREHATECGFKILGARSYLKP